LLSLLLASHSKDETNINVSSGVSEVSVADGYCHVRIRGVGGSAKVKVIGLAVKGTPPTVAVADPVMVRVQLV
jgi:hypothetical protein